MKKYGNVSDCVTCVLIAYFVNPQLRHTDTLTHAHTDIQSGEPRSANTSRDFSGFLIEGLGGRAISRARRTRWVSWRVIFLITAPRTFTFQQMGPGYS